MDVPSSLTSLVMAAPALPASAWMAAALIVPLTSISMWKDVTADSPLMAAVMIALGSLGFAAEAADVGPDEPAAPAMDVGAAALLHALAMTTTSPASTERAGLGTRNTI